MKKLMLTAGVIVMGLSTTLAQRVDSTKSKTREQSQRRYETTDSKRNRNQSTDSRSTNGSTTDQARRNGGMNDQSMSPQREMVIVQPTDIPASLRQTLQDPKYQGWEDAIIYHNTRTGEYLVSPRPHRFTSEGQEISYGKNEWGKNRTSGMNGNRNGQSINQHRRGYGNKENNSDGSNTYSTNPSQDSTGVNETQSSSSPEQETSQGQSNSYRRDSTRMNDGSTDNNGSPNRDSSGTSSTGNTSANNKYTTNRISDQDIPTEGMVLVEENQVPENLKATLGNSDYSGWQQGKIYHNPATGEYILIMGGSSGSENQRSYRFDKDGKVIKRDKTNQGQ